MPSVLDVIKKAPAALQKVESDLPRSDQGVRDFPGKGLLTALVDTSGTELKRQRDLEDGLKMSMVKPLIEKYWMGDPQEREAVAEQIKSTLGGGKRTKAFLDKMFEVGSQIHGVNGILNPPPAAVDQAASGAVEASKQDQGEGGQTLTPTPGPGAGAEGEGVASVPNVAPSPAPISPVLAPPPTAQPAPNVQATAAATPAPPLAPPPTGNFETFRAKAFPVAMSKQDELKQTHEDKMAELKQAASDHMIELQAQIDAGRYDKALKLTQKVELVGGKAKYVNHWYDKDGNEVKKEVGGDALPNWAGRPKQGFIMGPGNRPLAVLLDPFTNQVIEGSENEDVIPPTAMLPRLSTRQVLVQNTETGELETIPLESSRGVVLGGGTGTASPTTTPAPNNLQPVAEPDEAMIRFIMSKNRGVPREGAIEALKGTSPETLAKLQQDAAQAGFLAAPPPSTGTSSATPSGVASGAGPQVGPPPTQGPVSTTAPTLPRQTIPGVIPPGQYNQSTQRGIPIREAYTQLVGSPDFPDVPSLMTFAHIADDPAKRDKLAKALKLTFEGIQQDEKAHGSLVNLFKLYAGIPAAEINAQVQTYAQGIGDMLKDDPELQDAYNAEMAAFATAVGLRSLTRAGAAQASVDKIEREIPLFGLNSFSSRDTYSKLGRLMLEVHNGAKNTPTIAQKERDYISKTVDELNKRARGGAISPPPGSRGAGAAAAPAPVMRAVNPKTGERRESTDGGQSWHKPQ